MRYTVSLTKNRDFHRLYSSGRSAADPYLAVYCRKNKTAGSRLGITTGKRIGKAVTRNRVRRLIREAYRLSEMQLSPGYDVVVVARQRAADASFWDIDASLKALLTKTGVRGDTK